MVISYGNEILIKIIQLSPKYQSNKISQHIVKLMILYQDILLHRNPAPQCKIGEYHSIIPHFQIGHVHARDALGPIACEGKYLMDGSMNIACVRTQAPFITSVRCQALKQQPERRGCGGGGWWAEGALFTGWATFYQKSSGLTELSHVQAVQWQSLYFMSCNKYTIMFRQDFIKCKTGTCVAKCHCRGCQL